jgi:hypothetical protein
VNSITRPHRRGEQVEGVLQVIILLAIGSMAAAASFTHVHNVASAHGQRGWLAWADAVVLELMSIATGLEIRRRHRHGRPAGFVLTILVAAVTLSLSAQVVEAERSIIGWLAAALPAAGFLALVKIVLTRTSATTPPMRAAPPPPHPVDSTAPVPAFYRAATSSQGSDSRLASEQLPRSASPAATPGAPAFPTAASMAYRRGSDGINPDEFAGDLAPIWTPESDPWPGSDSVPGSAADKPSGEDDEDGPPPRSAGTSVAVAYWYRTNPNLHPADIAARIGKSERTVRRYWPPTQQPEPVDDATPQTNGSPRPSPAESGNHR